MVRGCSKPIRGGILGIESEVLKFGGKIRDIQEFYLNAPEAPGDLTERIKKRNKAVFDEFEKLRAQRRKLLDAFRCDFYRKQTCTAASGDTRTCPRSFAPPAGKLFVVESITVQGTGLVSEVKTSDSSISFLMRTSGGKNTLHIRSRLRATPKSIAQLVEDELQSVRRALAAYHLPDDKLYVP
jgi:glycogen debranching enzyme